MPRFYISYVMFQAFMEEMTRKQPDVDKVTKTYKRKAAESTSGQSQIPVLDKGKAGRKYLTTENILLRSQKCMIIIL